MKEYIQVGSSFSTKKTRLYKKEIEVSPKVRVKTAINIRRYPIFDWGPYEQLIEDLRCIDGPGLGEKAGSTVEHIDDLFSK